jgi:ribulose-5-phosphate 4-epimerase/fuculose-1-phosphate aldolase
MSRHPDDPSVALERLRADLALALPAAAHHGLAEGVCKLFSVELSDGSGRYLLNPRGMPWSEVQAATLVIVDAHGAVLDGRHPVEPTAMFIHAAIHRIAGHACVLHTDVSCATHGRACSTLNAS